MQIKRLTPDLAAGPQITESEIGTIAALGFRSIVANRPDGETEDQPPFESLQAAAEDRGLEARYIPVVASKIAGSDVERFREALLELPKPIFAFCRTGTRAALLWALANNDVLTADERMRTAAAHGFDLTAFRDRIAEPQ